MTEDSPLGLAAWMAEVAPHEARPAPPREWLERTYADLRPYRRRERAGHFMAIENPEGFVHELRSFFGELASEH